MEKIFSEVTLQNIWRIDQEVLRDCLAIYDNLDERVQRPFEEVRDKIPHKNMQFAPSIIALVCTQGYFDIEVDFKRYRLEAGHALVITRKQVGELHDVSDDVRLLFVAIMDAFYDPNINNADTHRNRTLLERVPYVQLSPGCQEAVVSLYGLLKQMLLMPPHLYQIETVKGLLHAFFFGLFAELAKTEKSLPAIEASPEDHRQKEIFTAFLLAVGEHYTLERNIKYYADILCITPKYLSQIIYQVSGRFAGDYIREYVIREAKALIRTKKYSMFDISVMLNFSTQSSFTRFFKNATGMSPLEFQNS